MPVKSFGNFQTNSTFPEDINIPSAIIYQPNIEIRQLYSEMLLIPSSAMYRTGDFPSGASSQRHTVKL